MEHVLYGNIYVVNRERAGYMTTIKFIKLLWLSVSQTQKPCKISAKTSIKLSLILNVFKPWQQKWWIYFALVVRGIFSTWRKYQTFRQLGPGNSARRTKVTKTKSKIRLKTPQNLLTCKYIKTGSETDVRPIETSFVRYWPIRSRALVCEPVSAKLPLINWTWWNK